MTSLWLAGAQQSVFAFTLQSSTLAGGTMPEAQRYDGPGCGGANVSPALSWDAPPAGTHTLVLTMFDRDARAGLGWWHWAVVDIPATARSLPLGAGAVGGPGLPTPALMGRNSSGNLAYGGACPPPGSGEHHYVFTLYALPQASFDLHGQAPAQQIDSRAREAALGSAELTVVYGR